MRFWRFVPFFVAFGMPIARGAGIFFQVVDKDLFSRYFFFFTFFFRGIFSGVSSIFSSSVLVGSV